MTSTLKQLFSAFFLFALSYSLSAQKDSIAYPSLLWEITGNGMSQPSYLYGTMHVSDKVAFHLGKEFLDAIESCETVALELNPADWMEDIQHSELYDANYELSNVNTNGNGFYLKAFKISPPDNKSIGQHLQTEDALVNQLLYRTNALAGDYEEKTYLDLYIFQIGKKLGKNIFSLEDYDEVEALSVKAMIPDPDVDQDEIRKNYRKMYSSGINVGEQLEDAYRTGNLDQIDSLSKMSNAMPGFQKYMVVQRNETMAEQMDSIMQHKALFTGVGAAHLPGEEGVIELLRNKGYQLKPIERSIGGKSKAFAKKVDKQVFSVNFKEYTAPDGSFTLSAPGKMYEMASQDNAKIFMHPEMVNGTYYWVKRIQTYAQINGQDQEHTKKRLDSLLYENIPGEIVKQREIETNGIWGYDITNVTSKNNTQRYQIYVLPYELMVFKMGGTGDYVEKYGKQFFNSISLFPESTKGWRKVSPKSGQFSVELPTTSTELNFSSGFFNMAHRELHAYDREKDQTYLVFQTILNEQNQLEEDEYELWQLMQTLREDLNLRTIDSSLVEIDGQQHVQFSMKSEQDIPLQGLVKKQGPAYYLLASIGKNNSDAERFLNSFEQATYNYERDGEAMETRVYVDTNLHFSVATHCNLLGQQLQSMGDNMSYLYGLSDEKPEDFEGKVEERIFNHPETGDMVSLEYVHYHKFAEFADVDSLFAFNLNLLADTNEVNIEELDYNKRDGFNQRKVLITDTATTQGIIYEMMQRNGQFYGLITTYDTELGLSPFQRSFYESFTPTDTLIGTNPYGNKGQLFLKQINSGDSALVHQALKSYSLLSFEEQDLDAFAELLKSYDFESVDNDKYPDIDRTDMVYWLGEFEGEKSRAILKDLYTSNEEDIYLQLACLHSLGQHKSKASFQLLADLLLDSPPPVEESYELWEVYRPIEEELELAKGIVDRFFVLNSIEEYRLKNYWLLSHMIREDVVDVSYYRELKPEIMIHCKNEMRQNFAKEGSSKRNNYDYDNNGKTNYDLIRMVEMLLPWRKEEKVAALIEKLKTTSNATLKIDVLEMLLRNDIAPDWEFIKTEAEQQGDYTRLYNVLRELNRLDYAPEGFFNQQDLGRSALIGYPVNREDSITFVEEKIYTDKRGKEFKAMYYKVQKKDDEEKWKLHVCYPMPADESLPKDDNSLMTQELKEIDEQDFNVEEQVNNHQEILNNLDRPRFTPRNRKAGNVFDFYYR